MAVDFSQFKKKLNTKEMADLEEKYKKSSGTFAEIPSGTYSVSLDKMEVKDGQYGQQMSIIFNITDGKYKGQKIFYNGSFDTHFAHGFDATARLISEMTDGDLDEDSILYALTQDPEQVADFLTDMFQEMAGKLEWDLKYTVTQSKKLNPNTNQPYTNKFYSIEEVFDAG